MAVTQDEINRAQVATEAVDMSLEDVVDFCRECIDNWDIGEGVTNEQIKAFVTLLIGGELVAAGIAEGSWQETIICELTSSEFTDFYGDAEADDITNSTGASMGGSISSLEEDEVSNSTEAPFLHADIMDTGTSEFWG